MLRLCLICFLGSMTAASAQDLSFSPLQTERCLDRIDDPLACVGASAEACMEASEGGFSTVVMGWCLEQEWQYWDSRLNETYRIALEGARQNDRESAGFGPSQEEALRAMQRAWIPFRDLGCDWVRSQWGGGTGGGPAAIGCLMTETARQTLFLRTVTEP